MAGALSDIWTAPFNNTTSGHRRLEQRRQRLRRDQPRHCRRDRALRASLNPKPGERILDLSTGTGWTARVVAKRGAAVVGVDIATGLLQAAREKAKPKGSRSITASATRSRCHFETASSMRWCPPSGSCSRAAPRQRPRNSLVCVARAAGLRSRPGRRTVISSGCSN